MVEYGGINFDYYIDNRERATMDFESRLTEHIDKLNIKKGACTNEETTKTALILPFFTLLGYDTTDPAEVMAESVSAPGGNKDQRVDYCLYSGGKAIIIVEAKPYKANLEKYSTQLANYYTCSDAKIAIITDGVKYRFYTDSVKQNIMDMVPFFDIDLTCLTQQQIDQLAGFQKEGFDAESITSFSAFYDFFAEQLKHPSDDLVRLFLTGCHVNTPKQTATLCDKYRPLVQKAMEACLNRIMKKSNAIAIKQFQDDGNSTAVPTAPPKQASSIVTTQEELDAFAIAQEMLSEIVPASDIGYKDRQRYMGVFYQNNISKWICRFEFKNKTKVLILPRQTDPALEDRSRKLNAIEEIRQYRDDLIAVLQSYL